MISKYLELVKSDFAERWSHVFDQFFGGLFVAVILFIFFQIWNAIYSGGSVVEGYSVAQMIWYLGFAEVLVLAGGSYFIDKISEDVRTGNIETALLKPMNYVGQKLALYIGKFVHDAVVLGFIVSLVCFLLVGPVYLSLRGVILALLAGFLGSLVNFVFIAIIGLLAFWLEDTKAFGWVYLKALFIFGGMLVPLDVYPVWLQGLIKWLPFSFIMYRPSKLFVHFSFDFFVLTVIGQFVWLFFGGVLLLTIYKFVIKRLNIHGG